MAKGWLLVNAFIKTKKFDEIYDMFFKAGEKTGIFLEKKTNAQLFANHLLLGERPDFVLFWDKDIHLAKLLEKKGIRLFNCADGIECCDNKILTYIKLIDSKIKMPLTYIAPKTFLKTGHLDYDFLPESFSYPVVVKEAYGSFGKQVFLAESRQKLINIISGFENRPFIVQEFIKSSYGRDIRINVVGGKAVAAMIRYNDNDFRANITHGGKMKKYTPHAEEEEMAVQAANLLNIDFGGIDILFGENGPVFCEANSNAHFKNMYDCTGVNIAEHIMKYIKKTIT